MCFKSYLSQTAFTTPVKMKHARLCQYSPDAEQRFNTDPLASEYGYAEPLLPCISFMPSEPLICISEEEMHQKEVVEEKNA